MDPGAVQGHRPTDTSTAAAAAASADRCYTTTTAAAASAAPTPPTASTATRSCISGVATAAFARQPASGATRSSTRSTATAAASHLLPSQPARQYSASSYSCSCSPFPPSQPDSVVYVQLQMQSLVGQPARQPIHVFVAYVKQCFLFFMNFISCQPFGAAPSEALARSKTIRPVEAGCATKGHWHRDKFSTGSRDF